MPDYLRFALMAAGGTFNVVLLGFMLWWTGLRLSAKRPYYKLEDISGVWLWLQYWMIIGIANSRIKPVGNIEVWKKTFQLQSIGVVFIWIILMGVGMMDLLV